MTETELEYQFCFNCNDRKNCYTKSKDCTRIKEEIGLQDMTNEEWLRSCTTMELAEFIRKQRDDWSDGWYSDCHRFGEIVEWLKQLHSEVGK